MGWEVTPEALHDVLLRLKRDYGDVEIYITENGAAFADVWDGGDVVEDPRRVDFVSRHVEALARAIADGVNVKGHCVWSLLDNYEWEKGYAKRFGLYYVDYPTQRRIPKRSALWYRDQIAASRAGS
jgi:beta-glucosidase